MKNQKIKFKILEEQSNYKFINKIDAEFYKHENNEDMIKITLDVTKILEEVDIYILNSKTNLIDFLKTRDKSMIYLHYKNLPINNNTYRINIILLGILVLMNLNKEFIQRFLRYTAPEDYTDLELVSNKIRSFQKKNKNFDYSKYFKIREFILCKIYKEKFEVYKFFI